MSLDTHEAAAQPLTRGEVRELMRVTPVAPHTLSVTWRPIADASATTAVAAIIAARDAEGVFLLDSLCLWQQGAWINEMDGTMLITAGRDLWWMPESELLAPLGAIAQPVDIRFVPARSAAEDWTGRN